jgi:hypothetical protein
MLRWITSCTFVIIDAYIQHNQWTVYAFCVRTVIERMLEHERAKRVGDGEMLQLHGGIRSTPHVIIGHKKDPPLIGKI